MRASFISQAIYDHFIPIAQDLSPALAETIVSIGPIQLLPSQDLPFSERLCRAVAGQQLSVKAAATIWKRVLDSADHVKPLMDYFATVDPLILRACGLSKAKARTMGEIAAATLAGQLDVEELEEMKQRDRAQRLTAIWGVGQWTADMMGIFYFGDPDIWPEQDTTARKMLERLISLRRKTIRMAVKFSPYRSYLALYMWRQADALPNLNRKADII